MRHPTR
jgi:NAD(P)-dependent dehydrogenase (short-subunit alcohol dehydrogenase family)